MGCTGLMPELAEGKFLFKTLLAPELRIKLMGGHKTLSSFQALSELALATDAIMASKHKAMAALQLTCMLPVQPPMPAAVIAAAKAKSDGKTPRIFAV
ncbi:hypothetical protein HK105_208472 [Polyrhizophydium stewartii]|uniref:Uncharacterized protein n=1 Tax=Polyrhizophydium stewartii TaxID=2732419 RepID=A0ABR4MXM4_9FUNG